MKSLILEFVTYYNVFVLIYFLVLNFSYLFLLLLAADRLFYYKIRQKFFYIKDKDEAMVPMVSILVPAYNEEKTIVDSAKSFLNVEYPSLEIIIINDGSSDNTLKKLEEEFKLCPLKILTKEKLYTKPVKTVYASAVDKRLIVIDKENGGKADSLNAALNYAKGRLFCAVDADSLIEKDSIYKIVQPYLERETKTVAVGGIVRVLNGCYVKNSEVKEAKLSKKLLPSLQVVEYIRAFLCGRTGWSRINSLLIISGAFGLFDRKTVIEINGYNTGTVGEDMELVVRLHKYMCDVGKDYKMIFVPEPVCWTQVPESLKILSKQRNRWQRGLIETLWKYRSMIFNPKYGTSGIISMPFFLFFEMLTPIVEISGFLITAVSYYYGWVNKEFMILFLLLAIVFGIILSLLSLLLEEYTVKKYNRPKDIINLFLLAVIENFGYRQIISYFRLKAFIDVFLKKGYWGEMKRESF